MVAHVGTDGGTGHIVELSGPTVEALSMEGRMTLCNLSVEAGARAGVIAPDDTTLEYIRGRPYAPSGEEWDKAVSYWSELRSDPDAPFDREVSMQADKVVPLVTWGTSPDDVLPADGVVPDPDTESDSDKRRQMERKIEYMGLTPGSVMSTVEVDQVFIGSCTNARIEDLTAAAEVLRGRKIKVPGLVVPGSQTIEREAQSLGLDKIFIESGFEWGAPGCSMCCGQNGDIVAPGKRCASTTNRNFEGRQGPGARTHLMSSSMAAAAAVTGHITDVRTLTRE